MSDFEQRQKPLVVVLTGGIASGKSVASDQFLSLGVPVIDTDIIARELVAPGKPALEEITRSFGDDYLDSEGALDRAKLRRKVFQDEESRLRLNSLLHPRIMESVRQQIDSETAQYCVVVIPLFVETGLGKEFADYVVVVDADEERQLERLMQRPGIDYRLARQMIRAQAPRSARIGAADQILENTGTIEALRRQVTELHNELSGQTL